MKLSESIGIGLMMALVCAACSGSAGEPRSVLPTCPQRWDSTEIGGWVPEAADIDGVADSLVPGSPVSALICAYPGSNEHPGGESLAGSRILTDQTAAMTRDLAYLPVTTVERGRACGLVGGPMTNYLIRFAYSGGDVLWVGSAEEVNHCVRTTNGTAGSNTYVGAFITDAYENGVWRPPFPTTPAPAPAAVWARTSSWCQDDPVGSPCA